MQAEQVQPLGLVPAAYGLQGVTAGDGEPELLVLVGGRDVLVGVGLDPRGDTHHHPDRAAELGTARTIHHAHTAAANLRLDTIALMEERARQ